ncbi:hypothetical protein WJX81_003665 [Elliptochloris bilobata]|uniref:Golgin-84 n=1 Tax=Elliptochloris bilobata TaxID=381761 RepID=A0AAW1QV14_9CHLO
MASWLQNQLKAAEGLLEAVDRTAKASIKNPGQQRGQPGSSNREPEHDAPTRAAVHPMPRSLPAFRQQREEAQEGAEPLRAERPPPGRAAPQPGQNGSRPAAREPPPELKAAPAPRTAPDSATAAAVAAAIAHAAAAAWAPAREAAASAGSDGAGDAVEGGEAGGPAAREARAVRLADALRGRLEQLRGENAQLEELLRQAESRATGASARVEQLEDELAAAQAARSRTEAGLASAVAAAEGKAAALAASRDAAVKENVELDKRAEAAERANEALLRERQASEGRLLAALREEVAAAEARAEEERAVAANARRTAARRETELEAGLAESAQALTGMQRTLDEKSRRLAAAEARAEQAAAAAAAAEAAAAELRAQQAHGGNGGVEAGGNGASEAGALAAAEAKLARLRIELRDAGAQRVAAEEEGRAARVEAERLRRQLAEAANTSDLDRQFKEVTELLYLKQTQLERMSAEKAAQQMALERELLVAREEAARVQRRSRSERAAAAYGVETEGVVPMEAMGEAYSRLANSRSVGGAVRAAARGLDVTASTFVRVLRQYPLGRLAVFCYVVFVHLFLYVLISRLQHRALTDLGTVQPQLR